MGISIAHFFLERQDYSSSTNFHQNCHMSSQLIIVWGKPKSTDIIFFTIFRIHKGIQQNNNKNYTDMFPIKNGPTSQQTKK